MILQLFTDVLVYFEPNKAPHQLCATKMMDYVIKSGELHLSLPLVLSLTTIVETNVEADSEKLDGSRFHLPGTQSIACVLEC